MRTFSTTSPSERVRCLLAVDGGKERKQNMVFKFVNIIVNMVKILKEIKLSVWTVTLSLPPLCWLPTRGLSWSLYTTSGRAKIIVTHTLTQKQTSVHAVSTLCPLCRIPAVLHRHQCSFPSPFPPELTHSDLFNDRQDQIFIYQTAEQNSINSLYRIFVDP